MGWVEDLWVQEIPLQEMKLQEMPKEISVAFFKQLVTVMLYEISFVVTLLRLSESTSKDVIKFVCSTVRHKSSDL